MEHKQDSYLLTKAEEYINEGIHLFNLEYYGQAEDWLLKGLTIQQKLLEPCHIEIADSLAYLGFLYQSQAHRIFEAEALLLKALDIAEAQINAKAEDAVGGSKIKNSSWLGIFKLKSKRSNQDNGLLIDKKLSNLLYCLNNLAAYYLDLKRFDEAEKTLMRSLSIAESMQKKNHSYVVEALNDLANLYHEQNRFEEAESHFLLALAIAEPLYVLKTEALVVSPDAFHSLVTTRYNLARFYQDHQRHKEAEKYYLRTMLTYAYGNGARSYDAGYCLYCIALLHFENGLTKEAEAVMRWALSILSIALKDKHPTIIEAKADLAEILACNSKQNEAYENFLVSLRYSLQFM